MSEPSPPLSSPSLSAKGSLSPLLSQNSSRKGFAKLPPGNELRRRNSIQTLKSGIDNKLKSVISSWEEVAKTILNLIYGISLVYTYD